MAKSLTFAVVNHGLKIASNEEEIHIIIPIGSKARKSAPMSASGKNAVIASTHGNIQVAGVTLGLNCYAPKA